MQNIRIEKRLPFGFKGEWGKLYKRYNYKVLNEQEVIYRKNSAYVELGQDVQFKYLAHGVDKDVHVTQDIKNLLAIKKYRVVETTDAYFDDETKNYECIISVGDIVFVFGRYWLVDKIEENSIYTPAKQSFYYCGLIEIKDKIFSERKEND